MRILLPILFLFGAALMPAAAPAAERKPNIVFILADDLGYGDVKCFNPGGKIATPNIDRLAAAGMKFTDAHSSSAVCTPTRYGIMTGRYNWRSRLKSGVQGGMSPRLIEPGRLTVAELLKQNGYHTAAVGKWHLGMDWPLKEAAAPFDDRIEKGEDGWRVDFSKPIRHGPNSVGFDYYFGISTSLDMVPYVFIENDRVTEQPTIDNAFPMVLGRAPLTRKGPAAPDFDAVQVLPILTRRAVEYIRERAGDPKESQPFFLYLPFASPHTPIVPVGEWQGKSGLNAYADFVMQTDASVGAVLDALDEQGIADNTLVIFTSDNGCSPQAQLAQLKEHGHHPNGPFRGAKADIFEGGHRVPFVACWPAKIEAGSSTAQLVSLNDLMATAAEIVNAMLPANAGEDSVSFLPALLGKAEKPLREALVHHSINGSFAIRQGKWKLALCPGSGGWSGPRPGAPVERGLPPVQLYDLVTDLGEQRNLQAEHPEVVKRLTQLLDDYVARGRSTPGEPQKNTGEVQVRKSSVEEPRAAASEPASPAAARPPHIVFILADDLGLGDVGCYGGTIAATPNLDRMAAEGTRFTQYYSASPICSPSRAGLMTGMSPGKWRITSFLQTRKGNRACEQADFLDPKAPSLPRILRAAGYATAHFGKWHLGGGRDVQDAPPFAAYGYDEHAGTYESPQPHPDITATDWIWSPRDKIKRWDRSKFFVDQTLGFIEQRREQPCFVNLWLDDPHTPWVPREGAPKGDTRENLAGVLVEMDVQIGRLLDGLRERGLERDTLVVFTSDNGPLPTFGGSRTVGLRGSKLSLYEGGVRVPLIVRWPGQTPAGRVDEVSVLSGLDMLPTLAAVGTARLPQGYVSEGEDIRSALRGQPFSRRTPLRWEYGRNNESFRFPRSAKDRSPQLATREGNWKLLLNADGTGAELYDLDVDRKESTNVLEQHPGIAMRLKEKLLAWRKSLP